MKDNTLYIDLDRIMPMVWHALQICVDWLDTHGPKDYVKW